MKKKIYCPRFLTGTEFNWISNVEEVDCPEKADIIVFSGGADINPELYKCAKHYSTYFNKDLPVISAGTAIPARSRSVGAISAKRPSCTFLPT